jgi:ethanolamine ammonia-lyase large subunit
VDRREFAKALFGGTLLLAGRAGSARVGNVTGTIAGGEGIVRFVEASAGGWDPVLYARLLGAANAFKEGDATVGVAAASEADRERARALLLATRLGEIDAHPPFEDGMYRALQASLDPQARARTAGWTFAGLRRFLLDQDEAAIQAVMPGLSSDVIGCVVKVLRNDELVAVSAKIANPLPGSRVGAHGYLGARIQPNSPTDDPEDIRWQVFDAWSYAVGDLLIGTNPVSSEPAQVHAVETCLQDLLVTFGLTDVLPHCVLAHVDVQAEVERRWPGSTALWFQSIAGSDAANATFDLTVDRMLAHADARTGRYGLYLETGQGADFTNGHAQGMDMVLHESRKYGLARLLSRRVAAARGARAWLHVNDVAGFIGPEVFRTRDQLVRCCLEDLVMGKLHGLCIGLDVCSTLHMDVSLDDLDACQEAVAPARPAYLMALPTKIDPMLGYLTTAFQDHVRLRERHALRVDDRMWAFFQRLGVIGKDGRPTDRFGDPGWVHLQYRRARGDPRPEAEIRAEGARQMAAVRKRGVFLAEGRGATWGDLEPGLAREIRRIHDQGKRSIWAELTPAFRASMPGATFLATRSADRKDYVLHPTTGEVLDDASAAALRRLRERQAGRYDVQIVVSDGLNALAITDPEQLPTFLRLLREGLARDGRRVSPDDVVLTSGRVRAGYRIGEGLFGGLAGRRAILHVIGERPGTGHDTFSVYLTCPEGARWGTPGKVDHDVTRVVAGIARTALDPKLGAEATVRILRETWTDPRRA